MKCMSRIVKIVSASVVTASSSEDGCIGGASGGAGGGASGASQLSVPEQVMLELGDFGAQRAGRRLGALLFARQLPQLRAAARENARATRAACEEVLGSRRLRRLLTIVLKIGNTLNAGGSAPTVEAFTLDSLLKLEHAKAFDNRTTILQYLVAVIERHERDAAAAAAKADGVPNRGFARAGAPPPLSEFAVEIPSVQAAARVPFSTLEHDCAALRHGAALLRQVEAEAASAAAASAPAAAAARRSATPHGVSSELVRTTSSRRP